MIVRLTLGVAVLLGILGFVACDEGSDVRTLEIAVGDAGCTPARFDVEHGERLKLQFENESELAFTITDESALIEELEVEANESADTFYTVPLEGEGRHIFRCESDRGDESEIELIVAALPVAEVPTAGVPSPDVSSGSETPEGDEAASVAVALSDFLIAPSAETIAPGPVNFITTNVSSDSPHELNILALQPDGSFINIAQIPPISPQQGGALRANLVPGTYRLACQIEIGEEGSTVDHYLQGMWFDILVR
jgi:plastocyanin